MRASSSRMTPRVSFPLARSAGSPAARKRILPSPTALKSGRLGPGVSSWMGHRMGETTSSGVAGWPSLRVSRNPCTAGPKARSRIRSLLTTLIPILTLIRSAGRSRIVRAMNGSSRAPPPRPRLVSSTPPRAAARAGQVLVGPAASEPWLIELPWCSHTLRPRSAAGSTGASVRRASSSAVSLCGSQSSTSLATPGRPVKRRVPGGPGSVSAVPATMSMVRVLPPATDARTAGRPSTSSSYTPSGRGGAPA